MADIVAIRLLLACSDGQRYFDDASETEVAALKLLVQKYLLEKRVPGLELLGDKADMRTQYLVTEHGRSVVRLLTESLAS